MVTWLPSTSWSMLLPRSCSRPARLAVVHVHAELGGQQAGDMRDLDGVVEDVLAVARAVLHPAEQLDYLRVQAVDVGLERGALALGLDGGVDLALGLGDHLLDAGRVDAPVLDELFQRYARDLAPHGVKAGER